MIGEFIYCINGKDFRFIVKSGIYDEDKKGLKSLISIFKENKSIIGGAKLKIVEDDCIREIDLKNNKVYHKGKINISNDDPKTFDKILSAMSICFDGALRNELLKVADYLSENRN